MSTDKFSVLLPTYVTYILDDSIAIMRKKTFQYAEEDYEIVIVDDNSPDGTYEVARKLETIFPGKLVLMKREGKLGLGSAYMDGLKKATGNYVFIMDCDLSHNPKDIPRFIKKMRERQTDIVTGSRYTRGGGVYGWNLKRKLTSRVANYLADTLLMPDVTDLTGSYRLYKKEALERIMTVMESKGYVFQMEVIVRARQLGFTISEVPITFVDRIYGESKLGSGEIVQYLKGLFHLFFTYP